MGYPVFIQSPAPKTTYPYRDAGIVLLVLAVLGIAGGALLANVCGATILGVCVSYPYSGVGALAVIVGFLLLIVGLVLLFVPEQARGTQPVLVYPYPTPPGPPMYPAAPSSSPPGYAVGPSPPSLSPASSGARAPQASFAGTRAKARHPVPLRKPRRRLTPQQLLVIGGVLVIAGILVGSVLWYEYQPGEALNPVTPLEVQVTEVVWEQYNSSFGTTAGFSVEAGSPVTLGSPPLTCDSFLGFNESCSTGSIYVQTPGFGLRSTNAPATWWSGNTSSEFSVRAVIVTPQSNYSGPLTLDLF